MLIRAIDFTRHTVVVGSETENQTTPQNAQSQLAKGGELVARVLAATGSEALLEMAGQRVVVQTHVPLNVGDKLHVRAEEGPDNSIKLTILKPEAAPAPARPSVNQQPLSDAEVDVMLRDLGFPQDDRHRVLARALLARDASLTKESVLKLIADTRAFPALTEPQARAAALLQKANVPVSPTTVSLVLARPAPGAPPQLQPTLAGLLPRLEAALRQGTLPPAARELAAAILAQAPAPSGTDPKAVAADLKQWLQALTPPGAGGKPPASSPAPGAPALPAAAPPAGSLPPAPAGAQAPPASAGGPGAPPSAPPAAGVPAPSPLPAPASAPVAPGSAPPPVAASAVLPQAGALPAPAAPPALAPAAPLAGAPPTPGGGPVPASAPAQAGAALPASAAPTAPGAPAPGAPASAAPVPLAVPPAPASPRESAPGAAVSSEPATRLVPAAPSGAPAPEPFPAVALPRGAEPKPPGEAPAAGRPDGLERPPSASAAVEGHEPAARARAAASPEALAGARSAPAPAKPDLGTLLTRLAEALPERAPLAPLKQAISEAAAEVRYVQLVNGPQPKGADQAQYMVPLFVPPAEVETAFKEGRLQVYRRPTRPGEPVDPDNVRLVFVMETEHLKTVQVDLAIKDGVVDCAMGLPDEDAVRFVAARLGELEAAIALAGWPTRRFDVRQAKAQPPKTRQEEALSEIVRFDRRV